MTLYERFVKNNSNSYLKEVQNLDDRIRNIASECGLFEEYFKTGAGEMGENLCHFADRPKAKLRLYFIEFGFSAIVLGGGGMKAKNTRATQDDKNLISENRLLGEISICLQNAIKKGHLEIHEDGTMSSSINFEFNSEDYVRPKKNK